VNNKQRKTLEAVFNLPTSKTLEWNAIESLLKSAGCAVVEGNGSRVRFIKDAHVSAFHRPHPAKEAKAYQVEQARDFLILIGVKP
jgi:hypothetical protein